MYISVLAHIRCQRICVTFSLRTHVGLRWLGNLERSCLFHRSRKFTSSGHTNADRTINATLDEFCRTIVCDGAGMTFADVGLFLSSNGDRSATEVSTKRMRGEESTGPLPNYLSSASKIFDQRMTPLLQKSAPSINIEYLRPVAHLMHKLIDVELDISLWTAYLQSGTGEWKDVTTSTHRPLLLWPHDVKTTMINKGHLPASVDPKTINHEECLAFVYQTVRQYRDQRDQYE